MPFPLSAGVLSRAPAAGVLRRADDAVRYLLRDLFTTDEAAPIASPRTCEPGPGTLTIVDTGNRLSISGGELVSSGITGAGDPRAVSVNSFARKAGRAFLFDHRWVTNRGMAGWTEASNPTSNPILGAGDVSGAITPIPPGTPESVLATATDYQIACVLRSAGGFVLAKGGAFSEWTLLYVGNSGTQTPLYAGAWARVTDYQIQTDTWRVADLPGPWSDDYGIATQRLTNPSQGTTATHEPNAVIEWTFTHGSTQTVVDIRRQASNNDWEVWMHGDGRFFLVEDVNGVRTTRASAIGVFTQGNTHRVVMVVEGNVYKGYVDNSLKWTYTDPGNHFVNNTTLAVEVLGTGASISEVVCWPRQLSGAALAELNRV